jgi:hypothetical protein
LFGVDIERNFFVDEFPHPRQFVGNQIVAPGELRGREHLRLSFFLRRVIGEQKPAPDVLRGDRVSPAPVQKQNPRAANFLAGMQQKMGALHSCAHAELGAIGTARKIGAPVPGPANGANDSAAIGLKIEKRQIAIGRTPADRAQCDVFVFPQRPGLGLEVILAGLGAAGVMEDGLDVGGDRKREKKRLDVLDDGRVVRA